MKKILIFSLVLLVVWSCTKNYPEFNDSFDTTKELQVPADFNFSMTQTVELNLEVRNSSTVLSKVPIDLYMMDPGTQVEPNPEAAKSWTLVSDENGQIQASLEIPTHLTEIYLVTDYIGLPSVTLVPIMDGEASFVYGTSNGYEPNVPGLDQRVLKSGIQVQTIGTYNSQGVPNYLEPQRDRITQSLLERINASLPESSRLPDSHPDYLAEGNEANILITENADVWVTFVHEGAGYKNVLGYYVYDQDNPPQTLSEIESFNVIFPNFSYRNAGGGLVSGDKVHLGQFSEGQAIGWFLLANGWSNGSFNTGTAYFSDSRFNPEVADNKKQHMVLLYDDINELLLIGFEDINREGWSDEDFNDAVFYVSANPITAIDIKNVQPVDTPGDSDNDGVSNTFDDFPNDPTLAYNNHYPAENQNATLVVEDLWPSLGDFDFNDLVLDYHIHTMADPSNKVKKMAIDITVKAIGASFRNGFGIELPVNPGIIQSVTGQRLDQGMFDVAANGTERQQSKAVIPIFEDAFDILPFVGDGAGLNTLMNQPKSEPQHIYIEITFASSVSLSALGAEPYNPFVVVNGDRRKEIHLPGKRPTSLADASFFNSGQDDTKINGSKFYLSKSNLPWMLNVPAEFIYPTEKTDIIKGYNHFGNWATSGGLSYTDWYLDKTGYRNSASLYTK